MLQLPEYSDLHLPYAHVFIIAYTIACMHYSFAVGVVSSLYTHVQMLILVLLLISLFPLLRTSEDSVNGELFIVLSVCDVRAV